jgi:hypothetical protein
MTIFEKFWDYFTGKTESGQYELFNAFILITVSMLSLMVVVAAYYIVVIGV